LVATLLAAFVVCLGSLFIGQAALRLAGAREWSWLAPAVGLSIGMAVATPAIHVPGRTLTVAILLGVLMIAAAVWCLGDPAHRPPLRDLATAAPVAAMLMIPFLAAGRSGILGTSLNNDMSVHLLFVEGYVHSAVSSIYPLPTDYPLGPHAMSALLSKGMGIESQQAFTGWTIAVPIINAWVALAAARRASWPAKLVVATVVGLPFLVAAYYGQGAFKEICQGGLVLAVALAFGGYGPKLGRGRWVPLALLLSGMVSVYSITGLPWALLFIAIWLGGRAAINLYRHTLRAALGRIRGELPALGIGVAVLVVSLLPQIDRIASFISKRHGTNGTGISTGDIGNLVGPLPGWESFGVWGNADFRFPDTAAIGGPIWTGIVVALVLIGSAWALRRGRWMLPLAAGGTFLIWALSSASQSPYVSAKGLVIASPLLLLAAALPLTERAVRRSLRWWAVPVVGAVLIFAVGVSDVRALRISPVGPVDHAHELESLRPDVAGQEVLFLGQDDYIGWELAGSLVKSVVLAGGDVVPIRPQKAWQYGEALDFDSVDAAVLNRYSWVVTTRDAAGSAPPPQLHLAASTRNYELWHRVGRVRERSVLPEGQLPGAVLKCSSEQRREFAAGKGVAAVRTPPVVMPVTTIPPGDSFPAQLTLPAGRWELEAQYTSSLPVEVSGPGLRTTLPANLDRAGPRWPIGTIVQSAKGPVTIEFKVEDNGFAPSIVGAAINELLATRVGPDRIVPLAQACGKYVDWYRLAGPAGR
jgi:hypothetical protein